MEPEQDVFQSPKSGKFESNVHLGASQEAKQTMFQSPKSGKFESNLTTRKAREIKHADVSIP